MAARAGLVCILVLVSALGLAGPPVAWSTSDPTCTFSAVLTLVPSLHTAEPSQGEFHTADGDEGDFRCRSPFGSGETTGRATGSGRYGTKDGDSCSVGGEGEGVLRLYDDRTSQSGRFTFTYSEFSDDGISMGQFHSDRFEGTFTLSPQDGSCVAGLNKVQLEGKGWVR